jgi:hypothetical protein
LYVFEDRGAIGPSYFTVVLEYIVNQPSRADTDAIGDLLNITFRACLVPTALALLSISRRAVDG